VAGIAKCTTIPAHVYWSLIRSCHSDQAITHPLRGRGTARFNIGSIRSLEPIGNRTIRTVHRSQWAGHAVTGGTHPRCKPQPTGAWESPRAVSESPRPKESQSPDVAVKSISTDNPKDGVHTSSLRKPPPHPTPHTSAGPRPHQKCGSRPSPHHRPPTKSSDSVKQLPIGINVTPMNLRDPVNTK